MKSRSLDTLRAAYRLTRRQNFAASQRLEGIYTTATRGAGLPSDSKAALLKKYGSAKPQG